MFKDLEEQAIKQAVEAYVTAEITSPEPRERIEMLGLSSRALNILKQYKVNYLDELCQLTEYDLFKMRHMGKQTIAEIKASLKEYGCKLGE